jgi:hypothetical protein
MLNKPDFWARIAKIWSPDAKWSSWSSPYKLEKYCARRMKRAGWEIQHEYAGGDVRFYAYYDKKRLCVACKSKDRLSIIHCSPIQRFAMARKGIPVIIAVGPIDRMLHDAVIDGGIYLISLDDIERLVYILDEPIDNLRLEPYVRPDIPDSWEILRRPVDGDAAVVNARRHTATGDT